MRTVVLLVVGYFAGSAAVGPYVRRQCDQEWARMLENEMVGPGQTQNPLRSR